MAAKRAQAQGAPEGVDEGVRTTWDVEPPGVITSRRVVGSRWDWAAELALLGMFYGLAAPLAAGGPVIFALCASFGGAASGAFLGRLVPGLLEAARRRRGSLLWVVLGGLVLGAPWGAFAGFMGGIGVGWPTVGLVDGALVGAALGLLASFPLVWFHVLGVPRTSLLAVLCALAPLLGVVFS